MKKNNFFATFASGMQYIVKDILEKQIPGIKIHQLFDGAVFFETGKTYDKLNMYCFNNIFSVITYVKSGNGDIESFIRQILYQQPKSETISVNNKNHKTFRVVVSRENRLTAIDNQLKIKLEKLISAQSGLKLNRNKSDAEFWILYRTEGFCYFLKRLSRHASYEKLLNKGELHPEIAFLMNWFSEAGKNDIMLDPFCGRGSIPLTRALHFSARQIYAFDADAAVIGAVKKKIAGKKSLSDMKNITVKRIDIKDLERELAPESVDKIVTDPPWGLYENLQTGTEEFYRMALAKMEKLLKDSGIMVLLLGRNIAIETEVESIPNLVILQNYNVLVSGKKASLVKLKKIKI